MVKSASCRVVVLVGVLAGVSGCGREPATSGGGAARSGQAPAVATSSSDRVNGTFTGLFIDLAGGPVFTECETGRQWTVGRGGAATDLEQAYFSVRSRPEDAIRATVEAHSGPAGAGGGRPLLIDKVVMVWGESVCPGQPMDASLTGTHWRMVALPNLNPRDVDIGAATLRLDDDTKTLRAYTGCRSVSGTFRWVGTALTFGGIEVGDERCPSTAPPGAPGMDASVLELLRSTGSYRIRGDTLELMGEQGVLARFVGEG